MNSKKIKVEIPGYLSIDAYTKMGDLDNLTQLKKIVKVLSALTGFSSKEIETWNLDDLYKIYEGVNDSLFEIEPMLMPIFEYKDQIWGLQPISKMTVGEFIDLENELQQNNYLNIFSILYRPVINQKFDTLKWKLKYNFKYVVGEVENLFNYYDVVPYDFRKTSDYGEVLKELPVSLVMGVMNFFLSIGMDLEKSILISSLNLTETEKKNLEKKMDQVFNNISDGSPFWLN